MGMNDDVSPVLLQKHRNNQMVFTTHSYKFCVVIVVVIAGWYVQYHKTSKKNKKFSSSSTVSCDSVV